MIARHALVFALVASVATAMRVKRRKEKVQNFKETKTSSPGDELMVHDDDEATSLIMADFDAAQSAAEEFVLNQDFDLYKGEFEHYAMKDAFLRYTWESLTIWRIHQSYLMRPLGTVWEDDKLDQKCIVESMVPDARYVDYFVDVDKESAELSRARNFDPVHWHRKIQDLIENKEQFVIKASHGANGNAVHPYCKPSSPDYTAQHAMNNAVVSYSSIVEPSENWQIQMVVPGVIMQKCYDSVMFDYGRPLEFKILTLWGRVVGATLETRPKEFWVTREGKIWKWQTDQTADGILSRMGGKGKAADDRLDDATMDHIIESLRFQWETMRDLAEEIAKALGNDELRVDFFFGGKEGPRLNEITYMGGAARYPQAVQAKLASVLIEGYASRKACSAGGNCHNVEFPASCHKYDPDEQHAMPGPREILKARLRYEMLVKAGVNLGQGR